jgi:hypothetical protein
MSSCEEIIEHVEIFCWSQLIYLVWLLPLKYSNHANVNFKVRRVCMYVGTYVCRHFEAQMKVEDQRMHRCT